jgi:hypothetical protein
VRNDEKAGTQMTQLAAQIKADTTLSLTKEKNLRASASVSASSASPLLTTLDPRNEHA